MDARYIIRKHQLLQECQIAPEIFDQVLPRLHTFMEPFVASFQGQALTQHAKTYVSGLLSDVERKNVESIAYQFGQNRLGLQGFIGWADWASAPVRKELLGQVGQQLGQGDGVLVFDPSGFPKKGNESVGVQRQWCGRWEGRRQLPGGRVSGLRIGRRSQGAGGHAIVAARKAGTFEVPSRQVRRPAEVQFHTRHELALEMLDEHGSGVAAQLGGGRRRNGQNPGIVAANCTSPPGNVTCWPSPPTQAGSVGWGPGTLFYRGRGPCRPGNRRGPASIAGCAEP